MLYDGDGGGSLPGPIALLTAHGDGRSPVGHLRGGGGGGLFRGAAPARGGTGRMLSPSGGHPQGSADPRPLPAGVGVSPGGAPSTPRPGTAGSSWHPRGQRGREKAGTAPARPVPAEIMTAIKAAQTEPRQRCRPRAAPGSAIRQPRVCRALRRGVPEGGCRGADVLFNSEAAPSQPRCLVPGLPSLKNPVCAKLKAGLC